MNRRRLLAVAGTGVGGLAATAFGTRGVWRPFGGRLRVGLAPVVPAEYRAADREAVTVQLQDRLPRLVGLAVERATNEWSLLRGLADGTYHVVELGAVAGALAFDAGLAEPLVQPTLDGGQEYDGHLLAAADALPDGLPDDRWVAVGDPLATPTHAALLRDSTGNVATRIRWHEEPPPDALGEGAALAASDEFHAPSDATIHRSYPMPVPALYLRAGVGDPDRLRRRFASIEGGPAWFLDMRELGRDDQTWLRDAPEWLADIRIPPAGPTA